MKTARSKFVFVIFLCVAAGLSQAAELTWLTDLSAAQTQAKAEKKSVLLFFHGSDWCPPCVEMQKQVFASPEFITYAQHELVLVDVDFPEKAVQPDGLKRANLALKAKFNVGENYPTLVLLDDSGATLYQETGYSGGGPAEVLAGLHKHSRAVAISVVAARYKNLEVDEFEKMAADKQNIILDVRTPGEFAAGHIAGAVNLDVNSPDFATKAAALDKTKVYLVHCAAGVRSARACEKMAKLDFPQLYNLPGGFKAWTKAGKPVEK